MKGMFKINIDNENSVEDSVVIMAGDILVGILWKYGIDSNKMFRHSCHNNGIV